MIVIDENRLLHIFRNAEGHLKSDTPENRKLLLDLANDPAHRLGIDQFGNTWAARTGHDGRQAWVQIRDDRITNGGINPEARAFNSLTGLAADPAAGAF